MYKYGVVCCGLFCDVVDFCHGKVMAGKEPLPKTKEPRTKLSLRKSTNAVQRPVRAIHFASQQPPPDLSVTYVYRPYVLILRRRLLFRLCHRCRRNFPFRGRCSWWCLLGLFRYRIPTQSSYIPPVSTCKCCAERHIFLFC